MQCSAQNERLLTNLNTCKNYSNSILDHSDVLITRRATNIWNSKFKYNCSPCCLELGIHLRQWQAKARRGILGTPWCGLKNVFQFLRCAACSIHSAHKEGNSTGLPFLIYQHTMARIAAACEACGSAGAPSTLAEERLPHRTSACFCLKCIPGLVYGPVLPLIYFKSCNTLAHLSENLKIKVSLLLLKHYISGNPNPTLITKVMV